MKIPSLVLLISTLNAAHLLAGPINVVHAGPGDVLKFEVDAGGDALDFTLAHGANSGSFLLPDKPSSIKVFMEGIPSLEIPPSKEARIAVLTPFEEGFKWHLIPAKPTPDKWAFRIMNLSSAPAKIVAGKEPLEIAAGAETPVKVSGKSQIRVNIPDGLEISYDFSEPSAVIAFLYREGDTLNAILIPDR